MSFAKYLRIKLDDSCPRDTIQFVDRWGKVVGEIRGLAIDPIPEGAEAIAFPLGHTFDDEEEAP